MNNCNKLPNKGRDRQSRGANKRKRNDRPPNSNKRRNNYNQPEGRGRHFQKFVDNDHKKKSPCWPQSVWDCDNNRNNNYCGNGATAGSSMFPWVRTNPVQPLIVPKHINFEQQYDNEYVEEPSINKEIQLQNVQEPVITPIEQENDKEKPISKSINNSGSAATQQTTTKFPVETNYTINLKKENDRNLNLKQETKSTSSSSSSSSESSSSEEEPKLKEETLVVKPEAKNSKPPSSPLNIKLKPNTTFVNSISINATKNLREERKSSTSSSSEEESTPSPPAPPEPIAQMDIRKMLQVKKEVKSKKTKNNSEDDVVCIGHLENKIVLEDESDNEDVDPGNTLNIKSLKKTTEKCMICDKKGHTSFQCQMVCKNCSAPYHGYRTCPQPANLNTMLQMFLEFCMQQFQNFNIEKQIAINPCATVSKPKVNCMHLTGVNNKSNKLKRKHIKASESNTKTKAASRKRKVSTTKKKSKTDSDDSTDDDNEEDDNNSEKSSTESEDASSSSAESLVSYKKKRKLKNKNAFKAGLNLSNLSTNPVNLPIVLNGFPNLTVPTADVQNPTTSTNALNLNTLLLTQMFQNAIGSLK